MSLVLVPKLAQTQLFAGKIYFYCYHYFDPVLSERKFQSNRSAFQRCNKIMPQKTAKTHYKHTKINDALWMYSTCYLRAAHDGLEKIDCTTHCVHIWEANVRLSSFSGLSKSPLISATVGKKALSQGDKIAGEATLAKLPLYYSEFYDLVWKRVHRSIEVSN